MSLSIRLSKAWNSWQRKPQGKTASSPPTELYLRCDQLPLNIFIDCLIDEDLSGLIISGNPSKERLARTWEQIYIEYIDINQSAESLYSLRLQSEIALLSDEIQRVEEILYLISPVMLPFCLGAESELVEVLRSYGYRQTIDFTTEYSKVLVSIRNRLNPKKLRLDSRINELTEYIKSKASGKLTRSVFDTNLVRMSRFQGYAVRAKEITVAEYVMIFKDCISPNDKKEEA